MKFPRLSHHSLLASPANEKDAEAVVCCALVANYNGQARKIDNRASNELSVGSTDDVHEQGSVRPLCFGFVVRESGLQSATG